MEERRPGQGDNVCKNIKMKQNGAVLHSGKASLNPDTSCVTLGKLPDLSEPGLSHWKRVLLEEPSSQDCWGDVEEIMQVKHLAEPHLEQRINPKYTKRLLFLPGWL